jgi:hypothetical protein
MFVATLFAFSFLFYGTESSFSADNTTVCDCSSSALNGESSFFGSLGGSAGGTATTSIVALTAFKVSEKYIFPFIAKYSKRAFKKLGECVNHQYNKILNRKDPLEELINSAQLNSDVGETLYKLCKYWKTTIDAQIDHYVEQKYDANTIAHIVTIHEDYTNGQLYYRFPTSDVTVDMNYAQHSSQQAFHIENFKNISTDSPHDTVLDMDQNIKYRESLRRNASTIRAVRSEIDPHLERRLLDSIADYGLRTSIKIKLRQWFSNGFISEASDKHKDDNIIFYLGNFQIDTHKNKTYFQPKAKINIMYKDTHLNLNSDDILEPSVTIPFKNPSPFLNAILSEDE